MNKALILIPLLPLLLLPGCKKAFAGTPSGQTPPPVAQESNLDQLIRQRVELALQQERSLREDVKNVRVTVTEGNVLLTGTASSDANQKRFSIVTNAVGSVVRVDNQIVVKHP